VTTLAEALQQATTSLEPCSDSARLDAELLICHVLKVPRTRLITESDHTLAAGQQSKIENIIARRVEGQPIAYLLGYQHFWDLKLKVTRDTLVPRPETELLVETALELYGEDKTINVIDLGTGSGAIALAIAKSRPNWHVTATDQSHNTLAVAIENTETCRLDNVTLIQSHWFDSLNADIKYGLIVSNPPYVTEDAEHLQHRGVRFEPQQALRSGPDGLDDIRLLIPASKKHLNPGGWLLLEHGFDQGDKVKALFTEYGYKNIEQKKDLAGHVRITYGNVS